MTTYHLRLDGDLREFAEDGGFDPTADIVRSAVGLPVSTGLSEEEYTTAVKDALHQAATEAVVDDDPTFG